MKKFLFPLALGLLFLFSSCGKDGGGKNCNETNITKSSDAIVSAATKFSSDPSKANCEAYKQALNDYLDVVDGCTLANQAQVDQARNSLNALTCP
jgi:uncharacterized protein YaaR (DUF327 family)